jgi:tetratricopeptide (TPR) repeat protein
MGEAYAVLGAVYRTEGSFPYAIACFERAVDGANQDPEVLIGLGECLFEARRYDEAAAVLTRAADEHGDRVEAHVHLARLRIETGALVDASSALAVAAALHPGSERIHHLLGVALMRRGLFEDAMSPLERAIEIDPDTNPKTHFLLGEVLLALGRVDEAIASFKRSARIYPLAELYYPTACAYHLAQRFETALTLYDRALARPINKSRRDAILFNQADILFELGEEEDRHGRTHDHYDRAEEKLVAALELNPEFHAARHLIALLDFKRGENEAAVATLAELRRKGAASSPTIDHSNVADLDAPWLMRLHEAYGLELQERWEEARQALKEVLGAPEVQADRIYVCRTLRRLGAVVESAGEAEEAWRVWRRVAELDPDDHYGAAEALRTLDPS